MVVGKGMKRSWFGLAQQHPGLFEALLGMGQAGWILLSFLL